MGSRSNNSWPPIAQLYTTAGLPDATAFPLQFAQVSDIPGVGLGLMWSDGTTWHSIPFSAQKLRVQTAADGTYTFAYPIAYPAGYVPRLSALVEAPSGSTDVINIQVDGVPTNTQAKFRVTRTQQSVVALLGLTILSIPASVGVQWIHIEVFG